MEWVNQRIIGAIVLTVIGLFIAQPVSGGTVLLAPPPESDLNYRNTDNEFPESRFGRAPMRVNTGISEGYAARATEELEDNAYRNDREFSGSRNPAGLVFTSAKASGNLVDTPRPRVNLPEPAGRGRVMMEEPSGSETSAVEPSNNGGESSGGEPRVSSSHRSSAEPEPLGATRRKGIQEVALIASDSGYFPKTVFVTRDIPVRLFVTGASKHSLCIMMDSFQVRKQVRSQKIEEITFTPNTPGKYRFYCPVNGMEGTLIVKEFASNSGSY